MLKKYDFPIAPDHVVSIVFLNSLKKAHYDVDDLLSEVLNAYQGTFVIDDAEVSRILHLESMTYIDSDGFRKFYSHI